MTTDHPRDQAAAVGFALLVVSDSRTETTDESGALAKTRLTEAGHQVVAYRIVKNDRAAIQAAVLGFLHDDRVRVILTSGGTGISRRDVTVDVLTPLFEKTLVGFGEFFRQLSRAEIGDAAMISRATAGLIGGKVVFCLPGSKNAMDAGLTKLVLPGLGHLLWEAAR